MKSVIVLIAHGTVSDLDDLPAFLAEIRHGRPAPAELVEELRERYQRIGGSPLLEQTELLAAAVAAATGLECRVAMRLWEPRLADVVADLASEDLVCLVPLAPYSVAIYEAAARRALSGLPRPPRLVCVQPWGEAPGLIEAWASRIRAYDPEAGRERRAVLLTAHSLPRQVIERGDPYAREFETAAARLAQILGRPCQIAYQSQGALDGAWLGPSLEDRLKEAQGAGAEAVVVAPIGFLSEHVETLFDLDVEARAQASALGLDFARVATLGADPALVALLGDLALGQLAAATTAPD